MSSLRAAVIATAFLLLTLACMPVQWLALSLSLPVRKRIPLFYHRLLCRLIGIRIKIIGKPIEGGGLLLANHAGWLDIIVLSSVRPLSFIAKSEVGSWPLFGTLARLQRAIFVRREARNQALKDRDRIRARLVDGDALVIFAEGTSSDGNRVLPFKSALLGAAELPLGEDTAHSVLHPPVQPVTVSYVGLYGIPMGRESRPFFAWYGDMELVPHLWGAFAAGPLDVVLEFHKPLTVDEAGNRKVLAGIAEGAVRAGLGRALHGVEASPAHLHANA